MLGPDAVTALRMTSVGSIGTCDAKVGGQTCSNDPESTKCVENTVMNYGCWQLLQFRYAMQDTAGAHDADGPSDGLADVGETASKTARKRCCHLPHA